MARRSTVKRTEPLKKPTSFSDEDLKDLLASGEPLPAGYGFNGHEVFLVDDGPETSPDSAPDSTPAPTE